MAVTNLYSNLPGHLVEFKDGGLQLTSTNTNTSSTKSLLILGTAIDGPINEPVRIDATTVSQVFGKEVNDDGYPNGATLTKYAKQAFKNGFDDVRCMRVTGSQAYTTIYGQEITGYETKSAIVKGSDAADGSGKIVGNEEFAFDFTNPPVGSDIPAQFVTNAPSPTDEFIYNGVGSIGLGSGTGNQWNAFKGFVIGANKYPMLSSLVLTCKGINFVGSDATPFATVGQVDIKTETISVEVSEDAETNIVSGTGSYATDSTGATALIFKDPSAKGVVNEFPDFDTATTSSASGYDINGYKVSKNTTVLPSTDYAIVDNGDGTFTITFEAASGVSDGDTITVSYFPYEQTDVEVDFTSMFNTKVAKPTLDASEMNDKTNAQIVAIQVGGTTVLADNIDSTISVNNGVITINDTTGYDVELTGDKSYINVTYSYDEAITSDLELKIKSQWGGSKYKDATVEVRKSIDGTNQYTEIVFTRPSAQIVSPKSFSYSSKYYNTVDDLILAMKNDINNLNLFDIEIVKGEGTYSLNLLQQTAAKALSSGGEDGLNPTNNEMFIALSGERYTVSDIGSPVSSYSTELVTQDMVGFLKTQGAYQILENYNVDYIYPAGVYADSVQTVNQHSDFQRELALVCAVLTYRTKMTHGFIDVKPNSNTTLVGIDAYVAKLVNGHTNIYYMTDSEGNVIYDSDNKPMDIGWYTSVVVGPEVVMTSDTLGTYYGSPAIAYAALNSVLEPQSSPLNKALRNVSGIKYKFSNKQMDAITGSRMVCFKLKNEGLATASSTPYVVDGVTSGAPNCDYHDIVTVKVITDVVDQIRQVADPFIGEQNTTEQRNALSALISKRLAKLVELGEIQSYAFEVSATIQQQLLGEASIALTIVPAFTLRKITTVVALRAAQ